MISPGVEYHNTIRKYGGREQAQDALFNEFIGKYWGSNTGKYGKPQESTKGLKNFLIGKIYTYNYDPLHADDLDFYDINPIMLCLGQRHLEDGGVLQLGINLNFIPPRLRTQVLDIVFKKFRGPITDNLNDLNRGVTTSQRQLGIPYNAATLLLEGTGFEFAIRSYYRSRISKPKIIDYDDWHKLLIIDTERVIGDSILNVYNYYNNNRRKEANRYKEIIKRNQPKKEPQPGRNSKGQFTKKKK